MRLGKNSSDLVQECKKMLAADLDGSLLRDKRKHEKIKTEWRRK